MLNPDRDSIAVEVAAYPALRPKVLEALAHEGMIKSIHACQRLLRVLVADDNRDAADSVSQLVTLWGHEAWTVYDGDSAIEAALAHQPDVLLLDISMPKRDGYEAARQLRRQPRFEDVLLIALTGWADQAHRRLGSAAGFDHYLVKPVEPSSLEVLLALEQTRLAAVPESSLVRHDVPRYAAPLQDQLLATSGR